MPNSLQLPDLNTVRSILSGVAPNWRFLAVMPEVTQQVPAHYQYSAGGASYSSSGASLLSKPQIPNAVLQSVDIPPVTVDTDQRFGQGTKIYVARFISTATITLNFYEDEYYNISKYLWAWHLESVDGYNLYGMPFEYKKQIQVYAFDSRTNYAPVMVTTFIDCFPTNPIGGLSYSQDASGFLTVSCEFTIDNQDFEFLGPMDSSLQREAPQAGPSNNALSVSQSSSSYSQPELNKSTTIYREQSPTTTVYGPGGKALADEILGKSR